MESIYESVLGNLKHKKASPETVQLWESIWSYIQKNDINTLDDYLNVLVASLDDENKVEEKNGDK
jgi:hypothetical protein